MISTQTTQVFKYIDFSIIYKKTHNEESESYSHNCKQKQYTYVLSKEK